MNFWQLYLYEKKKKECLHAEENTWVCECIDPLFLDSCSYCEQCEVIIKTQTFCFSWVLYLVFFSFYSTAALLFSKALFQNTNVLFMPYLMQLVRTMHISHVINECWVWNVVCWKLQHIVLQKTLFRFRKVTLHVIEIVIALSIVTTTHNTSDIQCCVSHV